MIKKYFVIALAILAFIMSIPVLAEAAPVPIVVDSEIEAYSVYASYHIMNKNVESLTVEFNELLENYGYSNYVNGTLWISIATADKIDFSQPLAYVTAILTDGTVITPDIYMLTLKINGKKAYDVSDVLLGDINGDDSVDPLDLAYLSRNLAKWSTYASLPSPELSDLNLDGAVDIIDNMILARHLANWIGYEALPLL